MNARHTQKQHEKEEKKSRGLTQTGVYMDTIFHSNSIVGVPFCSLNVYSYIPSWPLVSPVPPVASWPLVSPVPPVAWPSRHPSLLTLHLTTMLPRQLYVVL